MTRKAPFWILLAIASAAALGFAMSSFPRAFPIVAVDLRMDRAGALREARSLAGRLRLGPEGISPPEGALREAATFALDDTVKTFVELEGGGAAEFQRMLREHQYEAYTWRVRHFRAGETRELQIRFRPDGARYGFRERLREDAPGAGLEASAARGIAETSARRDWGVDLRAMGPYELAESSFERRPGGRIDHTFVYERRDVRAGEGRFRVRLVVSGDRLTELTHTLRVPEAFARRYEKLRSANTAIAFGSVVAMLLLYVVGGCLYGVFVLLRRRQLWWTPAFAWGFGIAGLVALSGINQWPLEWMRYDTAVSASAFVLQRLLLTLLGFVADGSLVALSLAAAEGLGRRAFPDHPQLWRMWSGDAAASRAVAGRTAGGVLLTGLEFGYIIGFYLIATRLWKWWTPAESLVDPNVLATFVPWLSAVAPSLHAGVWEEAMFRAIPLAGAALIGDRLGHRRAWIVAALVVEAVVFGSGHASYASEPAYSRPVELLLPSLVWGLVYLRFGLLPSIIAHYLFDLSLFSVPLFSSAAPNSRVDQLCVILAGAAPVIVVAWAMVRRRGFTELPAGMLNRDWSTSERDDAPETIVAPVSTGRWSSRRTRAVVAAGVLGLLGWTLLGSFSSDAPRVAVRRADALARAARVATEFRAFHAGPHWKRLAGIDADDLQSEFVWRALGRNTYGALIGRDLQPPGWSVRFATFEGDVAERAEEWQVSLAGDGTPWRVQHRLPQHRPGAMLDEAAARRLALGELSRRFGLDATHVREVSAAAERQRTRVDWTFTFADTAPPRLARGERRVEIVVAGDAVTDAHRLVFVPEDWQRATRSERAVLSVIQIVRGLLFALVFLSAAALGIIGWSRGRFPVGFAVRFFAVFLAIGLALGCLQWPVLESRFMTAQPYMVQAAIGVVALVLIQCISAALMALVAGFCRGSLESPTTARDGAPAIAGLATGALAAGLLTLLGRVFGSASPNLGPLEGAETLVPWASDALRFGVEFMRNGAVLFALLMLSRALSAGWTRRRGLVAAAFAITGGLMVTPGTPATAGPWLAQAALAGVALLAIELLVLRFDARLVPWLVAALSGLRALRVMARGAHPDAVTGAALGIVLVATLAIAWSRELRARPAANVLEGST